MAKYKRRKFFIDKQLQTKYIILSILMLLAYSLLFVIILIAPYTFLLPSEAPLAEQTEAARTLLTLHQAIWPALGAVILIMSSLSIFITHKIAGPVYRIRKVLAEVYGGNLDITIKLREKDDLKDLAEDLNMVIREQHMFVKTLRGDHETISACINELEKKIQSNQISSETGKELIEKMQTCRENINQALGKYS